LSVAARQADVRRRGMSSVSAFAIKQRVRISLFVLLALLVAMLIIGLLLYGRRGRRHDR